jgi:hypothetical protein
MVALQCMVVVGVAAGIVAPRCGSNDQCRQAGSFCGVGVDSRCHWCGYKDGRPLPPQTDPATGGALNDPYAPDFAGYNLTAVAELCADPNVYFMDDDNIDHIDGPFTHTVSSIVSWCKSGNDGIDL